MHIKIPLHHFKTLQAKSCLVWQSNNYLGCKNERNQVEEEFVFASHLCPLLASVSIQLNAEDNKK